jgi:DNA replication and repair protein RecF
VDFADLVKSISNYLEKNTDRDIITWYTYIWPHLDDFHFTVDTGKMPINTEECLSRWENKSILIWLKFLEIEFYKKKHSENMVILLDDIFSELDDSHISWVMKYCENYQTFITAQNMPNFLHNKANINIILT